MSGPGEGGGLAALFAQHQLTGATIWTVECSCGRQEGVDYYQHLTAAVHAWLSSALLAPEVVEAAASATGGVRFRVNFPANRDLATSALTAALSALTVGEVER